MQWEPVQKSTQAKIRSAHHFRSILVQFSDDTLNLVQVLKENVVSSRVCSTVKKTKEQMLQIHYRILKPKVQNLEAKHTNLIGLFFVYKKRHNLNLDAN